MTDLAVSMEGSVIEKTRIPLRPSAEMQLDSLVATTRQAGTIDFEMQCQCHSNWCWAAVAASVAAHYDKTTTFTQCSLANLELSLDKDCCDLPCHVDDVDCNVINALGSPLNRARCLRFFARNERATREQVQREIGANRPLCVRTIWSTGASPDDAHFLAIIGYQQDSDTLALEDPFYGSIRGISFDRFCTQYQDARGVWNDTYYTKRSS